MHFNELFQYCPACGSSSFEQHNEKSKRCMTCGFNYYINPSAAVAGFIFNGKGDLLVCRRAKDPAKGTLDLPGGFVDNDESAEQAMAREVREELGVEVREVSYVFSLPNDYLYSGLNVPTLDMFFKCVVDDEDDFQAADDVSECFFVPLSEIHPADFGLTSVRKAVGIMINQ